MILGAEGDINQSTAVVREGFFTDEYFASGIQS